MLKLSDPAPPYFIAIKKTELFFLITETLKKKRLSVVIRGEESQRWEFIKENKWKRKKTRRKRPRKKSDNGQEKKERKHALDQESKILEKKR